MTYKHHLSFTFFFLPYDTRMTTFTDVRKRHIELMRLASKTIGNVLANVTQATAAKQQDGPDG